VEFESEGNARMNEQVRRLTEEIQSRIRQLAYIMWDAAGQQQGMALEYWLEAEREVLQTMQSAADTLMEPHPSQQPPGVAETPAPPPTGPSETARGPGKSKR